MSRSRFSHFFISHCYKLFLGGVACLLSCTSNEVEKENIAQRNPQIDTVNYTIKELFRGYKNCVDTIESCTYVSFTYPVITDTTLNLSIRDSINNRLISVIARGESSVDSLVKDHFVSYAQYLKEFPPAASQGWFITSQADVLLNDSAIFSVAIAQSSFEGGAHPNSSVHYLNFNTQTGRLYTLIDFIQPNTMPILDSLGEIHFRAARNLNSNSALSKSGFQFANDSFKLTSNFGLTKEGFAFYYNAYEIAAYAEGPTELLIPYRDLERILRPETHLLKYVR